MRVRSAPMLIVAAACLTLAGADPSRSAPRAKPQPPARGHYFIDFRARAGYLFGHSFVVFGRTDERGYPVEIHRAGLYPTNGLKYAAMLGVMPVPGQVGGESEDLSRKATAVYRRRLTAEQFVRLKRTLRGMQRAHPFWHLVFHNCNDFTGKVAKDIGLATPPTSQPPDVFVRGLSMMNRR